MTTRYEISITDCYVKEWKNDKSLYSYCSNFVKEIPYKTPGVYYIYKDSELMYIGCSANLFNRLTTHLVRNCVTSEYINDATKIECIIIEDKDKRSIFEYTEIRDKNPSKNKSLPRLTKTQRKLLEEEIVHG
jgi:excinuclease UvrABC nuclease subunit